MFVVRCDNVIEIQTAQATNKTTVIHDLPHSLNFRTENGVWAIADLESIVFERVMGGSNHDAPLSI